MSNLENIRFQKLSLTSFSDKDRKDLIQELKKRKIRHRLSADAVMFDERFLKQVKDLIPASRR